MPKTAESKGTLAEQIGDIKIQLAQHFERESVSYDMVSRMYKILVVGNGQLPLTEVVRSHDQWIKRRDLGLISPAPELLKDHDEWIRDKIDDEKKKKSEQEEDERKLMATKRGRRWEIILMTLSQAISFGLLILAVILNLK